MIVDEIRRQIFPDEMFQLYEKSGDLRIRVDESSEKEQSSIVYTIR